MWTSCVTRPSWTLDVYVFLAILDHRIVVLSLHDFYSAIEELEKEGFARMVRHYPYITIALEVHLLMPAKLKNSRSNAVQCWRMIQTMDWLRRCRERPSLETLASGLGLTHLNSDGSIPPLAFLTLVRLPLEWRTDMCGQHTYVVCNASLTIGQQILQCYIFITEVNSDGKNGNTVCIGGNK